MDLDSDEIESLFGDERETRTVDDITGFHLGIDRRRNGVRIYTKDDEFVLTEAETESLLDSIGVDSIWGILSEKLRVIEELQ